MLGRPNTALSQIHMQIMWSRLIAVVEEQAQTLVRTAFSTTVREAGDLSAGVFDRDGNMLAQAVTGTPGHVNSMAAAVKHFLDAFPLKTMRPGDHYITNDPWLTCGHLHDLTVVSPTFLRGEPVGLFASTVHVVDIGGLGMGPDGRQVYRGGAVDPADGIGARRPDERRPAAGDPRQCARAAAGRGRRLCARRVQRRGQPAARRDDGGVRHRQSRPARRAHHRNLAPGDDRGDRQAQKGPLPQQPDDGRLRPPADPGRRDDDRRGRHPRRLCRHLAGQRLWHQRRAELHDSPTPRLASNAWSLPRCRTMPARSRRSRSAPPRAAC